MKKIFILFFILLLIGVSSYFVLKKEDSHDYVPQPFFKGDNQNFQYYGYVNDGDNKSSGESSSFRKPQVSAVDGQSEAHVELRDYQRLAGEVIAKTGPEARKNASARLDIKSTSSFIVNERTTCRYRLHSTLIPELENGIGIYTVFVKILDKEKREVPGAHYEVYYFVNKDLRNKILIFNKEKRIDTLRKGGGFSHYDINPREFILQPGEYVLIYHVVLQAQANGNAKVKVESRLDLI